MSRYFLHLAYNGTKYHGWQIQPNASSVQETLQYCVSTYLREAISITGCGRTDTGVHAKSFYAHFDSDSNILADSEKFVAKINNFLPDDIVIYSLVKMLDEAHSRFDAIARTYKYYISNKKEIFMNALCWEWRMKLNIEKMNEASSILFNYTDFTSFSKLHTDVKTNDCVIKEAFWEENDGLLTFTIKADRFLRNMVRSIVGTLIEIGNGKMELNNFSQVIELQDRTKAGISVPAKGLFLHKVEYPYEIG